MAGTGTPGTSDVPPDAPSQHRTSSSGQPAIDGYYRIDQVAARTALTKRTLRYYEEIGLLPPPTRTEGGYRLYSEQDIQHLELIKRLRDLLGFSLAEIREMAEAEEERQQLRAASSQQTDPRARISGLDRARELTQRQLAIVEEKLTGLQEMRATLLARLERQAQRRAEWEARLAAETSGPAGGAAHMEADVTGGESPSAEEQTHGS
jgi:DNA-binding transcriptional MerR regulator